MAKRPPKISETPKRVRSKKAGFSSGVEHDNARLLEAQNVRFEYEPRAKKIVFIQPEKRRTYLPDFILPNGMIIECKGEFKHADRQKHLWIKAQRPDLDIRFVFTNPKAPIRGGSKTTIAQWCDKHGFLYADKLIPIEWLKESTKCRRNSSERSRPLT